MKSHAGEMVSYSNIKLHYELYVLFCHAMLSIRKEGGHFVSYIALLCFVGRTKRKVKNTNERDNGPIVLYKLLFNPIPHLELAC